MFKSKKRKQREAEEAFVNYNPLRDAKERAFWKVINKADSIERYKKRDRLGAVLFLLAVLSIPFHLGFVFLFLALTVAHYWRENRLVNTVSDTRSRRYPLR